jgi:hypothetical protein
VYATLKVHAKISAKVFTIPYFEISYLKSTFEEFKSLEMQIDGGLPESSASHARRVRQPEYQHAFQAELVGVLVENQMKSPD